MTNSSVAINIKKKQAWPILLTCKPNTEMSNYYKIIEIYVHRTCADLAHINMNENKKSGRLMVQVTIRHTYRMRPIFTDHAALR